HSRARPSRRKSPNTGRGVWGATTTDGAPSFDRSLAQTGKDLGPLLLDGLERAWLESEQLQDRRRDLGRLDPLIRGVVVDGSGCVDEDRHVAVAWIVAAVLGDLRAAGVDDTDLNAAEHVGVARIRVGNAEEVRGLLPGVDLGQTGVRDLLGAAVHAV